MIRGKTLEQRSRWLPNRLVYILILIKVLVAIPKDFIIIIADVLYFYKISSYSANAACDESVSILDRRIAIADYIYWILFAVNITGLLKHIMLVWIAYHKIRGRRIVDPRMIPTRIRRLNLSETVLLDENAFMEFIFLQGVFAFIFQDAVAAFVQFQSGLEMGRERD